MKKLFAKLILDGNALKNKVFYPVIAALALIVVPAAARAQSLGDMMCSLSFNIAPFEPLMNGIAYIAGAIIIGSGLLQFIKHSDVRFQHEHPIHRPLAHVVAGACLLAFPAFLNWSISTIFTSNFGGGLNGCVPLIGYDGSDVNIGSFGFYGGNLGLDGLMMNLIMNIKSPMTFMLSVMSILIGIFLVIRGLVKASKFGTDPRAHSIPNILANLIIGTIVYTIGTSMNVIMSTIFGDPNIGGPGSVLASVAYDFGANTVPFQQAIYAALTFFQLVGFIAFIRGWLILKDAVEGQGQKTVAQGFTHILGGVMAINIYRVLEVFDTTFGTGFLS